MRRISYLLLLTLVLQTSWCQAQAPFEADFGEQDLYLSGLFLLELLHLKKGRALTKAELEAASTDVIPAYERHVAQNLSLRAMQFSDKLLITSLYGTVTNSLVFGDFEHAGLISLQVLVVNDGLNQLAKKLFKRKRPFTYNPDTDALYDQFPAYHKYNRLSNDARTSFYSGHSAHAASFSFLTATLFAHYHPDQKGTRKALFALAGAYPALMAHLRVRAGKHFISDVATGYLIGAAIGYGIPALHRTDEFKAGFDKVAFRQDLTLGLFSGVLTSGLLAILTKRKTAGEQYQKHLKGEIHSKLEPVVGPFSGLRWSLRF